MSDLKREHCPGNHTHEWQVDYDYETGKPFEFCLLEPPVCPECGTVDPEIEDGKTPGFTGAPIYWAIFKCCGYQDVDASADNLAAVR